MIHRIKLASGQEGYACDICGHGSSTSPAFCARTPVLQTTHLNIGDHVALWRHWGRYLARGVYTVRAIRYAGPGFDGWVRGRQVPLHTLIIEVAQNGHGEPWTPDSSGYMGTEIAYPDFLLWQAGDEEALRAAGLLYPLSFWDRVRKYFGMTIPSIKRP